MKVPVTDWFDQNPFCLMLIYLWMHRRKMQVTAALIWKCSRKLVQDTFIHVLQSVFLKMLKPIHIPELACCFALYSIRPCGCVLLHWLFCRLQLQDFAWRPAPLKEYQGGFESWETPKQMQSTQTNLQHCEKKARCQSLLLKGNEN